MKTSWPLTFAVALLAFVGTLISSIAVAQAIGGPWSTRTLVAGAVGLGGGFAIGVALKRWSRR